MKKEYKSLARYYDLLHNEKDYKKEATDFIKLINKKGRLLDVACGTGSHITYFKKKFDVQGMDKSKDLVRIAKLKNKDVKFKVADMTKFKSLRKFDIITCLFSSFAYLKNTRQIKKTLDNFYNSLDKEGIILIETLFLKDTLKEIKNHVRQYKDIKRTINIYKAS